MNYRRDKYLKIRFYCVFYFSNFINMQRNKSEKYVNLIISTSFFSNNCIQRDKKKNQTSIMIILIIINKPCYYSYLYFDRYYSFYYYFICNTPTPFASTIIVIFVSLSLVLLVSMFFLHL